MLPSLVTIQAINLERIGISPTSTVYISHFVFLFPIAYEMLRGVVRFKNMDWLVSKQAVENCIHPHLNTHIGALIHHAQKSGAFTRPPAFACWDFV